MEACYINVLYSNDADDKVRVGGINESSIRDAIYTSVTYTRVYVKEENAARKM